MNFRLFLENVNSPWVNFDFIRAFFDHGFDSTDLLVYADWLDEKDYTSQANFFRKLTEFHPKRKKGGGYWRNDLIRPFYDMFDDYRLHVTEMNNSWFIHPMDVPQNHPWRTGFYDMHTFNQMDRHIVYPQITSYRLSLTNGKWFAYTNKGNDRVSVVSTKHRATVESEQWYPRRRVTVKDYKPISVDKIPNEVLYFAFRNLIEREIRGGH